jgi:hypothetical protein
VKHRADPRFWLHYRRLPADIQRLADKNFDLLKRNPHHPSLRLKKVAEPDAWSARVGLHYRALAISVEDGFMWTWIGHHTEYDRLIGG